MRCCWRIVATVVYLRRFWSAPEGDDGRRAFALALLPVYGLISCASLLGVFTGAYAQPCWRVILLLGLLELSAFADRQTAKAGQRRWLGVPRVLAAASLAITALTLGVVPLCRRRTSRSCPTSSASTCRRAGLPRRRNLAGRHSRRAAGDRLASRPKGRASGSLVDLCRMGGGAQRDVPPVVRLHHSRARAGKSGRLHRAVPTVRPGARSDDPAELHARTKAWLENNSWAFYDELLRWYTITSTTPGRSSGSAERLPRRTRR